MNFEKIYKYVAAEYNVSVEEVKRELTRAVKASDVKINNTDEFILYIASNFILKNIRR